MIGIVVVSHSRALAEAAVGLAAEMVDEGSRPSIGIAAGLDEATFGTDASAVAAAIDEVDSPEGVLVLLDLGSAILSAEMALEFVEPEVGERVVLSSAPLVEGLVAAVVLASTGAPIDAVADEAGRGLSAKQDHLQDGGAAPDDVPVAAEDAETVEVDVVNEHGLHARPAAKLVALVRGFDATVTIATTDSGRGPVQASSLSMVATLNARKGDRLKVGASGPQAAQAIRAVEQLARRGFDDQPPPPRPVRLRGGSGLDVAIGPAIVPTAEVDISAYVAGDVSAELDRSRSAVAASVSGLRELRTTTAARVGEAEATIFDAHLALLDDPELARRVESAIESGTAAPHAWSGQLDAIALEFERLDDAYQRERAQDVRAIERRVLAALVGRQPELSTGSGILVVPEIDAATATTIDVDEVSGIVTLRGGATGHGVIVAKSRGIPIITDVGDEAATVTAGTTVAFDAADRVFVVDPDDERRREFEGLVKQRRDHREAAIAASAQEVRTRDGQRIAVLANVASVADAQAAAEFGADGSGLVRTEVLFGDELTEPSVRTQLDAFREVSQALGGRPITIRTWDVGGDKPMPFMQQLPEANPFLGERGLRLSRRQVGLLREQLKAVCLAAQDVAVKVMFPMVTTVEEVAWARQQLMSAAAEATGGLPDGLQVGIMIEVPAAALRAGRLAAGLDFVSIGTNDLTQYTVAAERGNTAVSALVDQLDPVVLGLVGRVCSEVPDGVEVAVCGELASDPAAAVLLAGLGVREFSATAPAVPMVKAGLRDVSLTDARSVAAGAVDAESASSVRELLSGQRTPHE